MQFPKKKGTKNINNENTHNHVLKHPIVKLRKVTEEYKNQEQLQINSQKQIPQNIMNDKYLMTHLKKKFNKLSLTKKAIYLVLFLAIIIFILMGMMN